MPLVITRRIGEPFYIGQRDEVTVTIVGKKPNGELAVAIDAPRDIPVRRHDIKNPLPKRGAE